MLQTNIYTLHHLNEYNQNKYKPGFKNQLIEFIKFSNGEKIINDLDFGKKIVKLCESITK